MSAPDTNIDRQVKRHKGPLVGIAAVVAAAGLLFIIFLAWTFGQGDAPDVSATAPSVLSSD